MPPTKIRPIGLIGNAAEILPELVIRGVVPDVVTDQTSAHDALNGYVPAGLSLEAAAELRGADPEAYTRRSIDSMATHVRAMLELQAAGSVTFDYGNNIRAQAQAGGVADAFDFPGFVPAFIRPLFCEGKGPFRWAALSGDPADIETLGLLVEAFIKIDAKDKAANADILIIVGFTSADKAVQAMRLGAGATARTRTMCLSPPPLAAESACCYEDSCQGISESRRRFSRPTSPGSAKRSGRSTRPAPTTS